MERQCGARHVGCRGFTLIECIVVLVLLGLLGLAGLEALRSLIASYQFARSSDAMSQKAQMVLRRITLELSYVDPADIDVSGTTVTNGTAPAIGYTASLPNGSETHVIFQDGTKLYYGNSTMDIESANLFTDDVVANGLAFSFYDAYNESPSAPSSSTTIVGVSLSMHGSGWLSGTRKTFSTRVFLNKLP